MTDPRTIADAYIRVWNETDAAARERLLAVGWRDDARYADPLASAEGRQRIGSLVGSVQQRFPGFRFALAGTPDGHGEHVRFTWTLGPAGAAEAPIQGSDVVDVDADGRIRRVVGFLDRVPG